METMEREKTVEEAGETFWVDIFDEETDDGEFEINARIEPSREMMRGWGAGRDEEEAFEHGKGGSCPRFSTAQEAFDDAFPDDPCEEYDPARVWESEYWSEYDAAVDTGYYQDPNYLDTIKIFMPYYAVTPDGVGIYAGSPEDVQAEACRRAEVEYTAAR